MFPIIILQLDPGFKDYRLYTLTWSGDETPLGQIVVPKVANGDFQVGTEYWFIVNNFAATSQTSLTFSWVDKSWDDPPVEDVLAFDLPVAMNLSETTDPGASNMLFVYTDPTSGNQFALAWGLTGERNAWSGDLNWYTTSQSFNPFTVPEGSPVNELAFVGDIAFRSETLFISPNTVEMPAEQSA